MAKKCRSHSWYDREETSDLEFVNCHLSNKEQVEQWLTSIEILKMQCLTNWWISRQGSRLCLVAQTDLLSTHQQTMRCWVCAMRHNLISEAATVKLGIDFLWEAKYLHVELAKSRKWDLCHYLQKLIFPLSASVLHFTHVQLCNHRGSLTICT